MLLFLWGSLNMMMSFLIRSTILMGFMFSSVHYANANSAEIEHLLNFVENTHCQYVRNGTEHSGKDAVHHIKRKFAHFEEEIETTEDFIRLSATKSTMSGKAYLVICDGKAKPSAQWLLDELTLYRNQQNKDKK